MAISTAIPFALLYGLTLFPRAASNGNVRKHTPMENALDTSSLLWGLLFGSVGFSYFIYGRKQKATVPLVCGLLLMAFPYFVSNTVLLAAIGLALMVIPFFIRD